MDNGWMDKGRLAGWTMGKHIDFAADSSMTETKKVTLITILLTVHTE